MRNYATTGFLTNSRRTIQFTISLDKPVINAEIEFSKLDIQVRQYNGDMLIDGDVIDSDYTVIAETKPLGIFITITQPEVFGGVNDMPVSVYIVEANGVFI